MRFRTLLQQAGRTATGFEVPPEVVGSLGAGKRPAVLVTINGHTYRSTVAVYGGVSMIAVSAENRAAAGVAGGEEIEVDLELDTEPRVVEVPLDLAAALDRDEPARRAFERLSYSHQRQHVLAIEGAKAPETRARRVAKTLEMLTAGGK